MILFSKSVALIRHIENERANWLVRWDPQQSQAAFVESPRLEGETYREALYREIDWQLGLDRKKDYLLSSVPRIHFEVSPCGNVHPAKTFDYEQSDFGIVEIYTAEVYRQVVIDKLNSDTHNCWSSSSEILSGVDGQGRPIRMDHFKFVVQSEAIQKSY